MKLAVGLVAHSLGWEELLSQEGIPFSYIDLREIRNECSVLIVNRMLSNAERWMVEEYLRSGGAVLASAHWVEGIAKTTTLRQRIDHLVADTESRFPNVRFIDLGMYGHVPREANRLRTQENTFAAYAGELGGGVAVLLPFDAGSVMGDSRAAQKCFYAERDRLPTERVSAVSKGEVLHLVRASLQYLHHVRNLPYVHLWYFPHGKQNLFAFRIDTDKGSRDEIDSLHHLAIEHDVRMTMFVDVKSHEEWLQHFLFLAGQEIGVHCYVHQTYDTFDENLKNISKAKHKLELEGISTPGFAAPFGIWNSELARAVDQIGFEYSSEFSFAYDTLPLYPTSNIDRFSTLQVPIHPVCIGSFLRVGYTPQNITRYFHRIIDEKLRRNEPLFLYHHPTHHSWDVVGEIFKRVNDAGIESMWMVEYARWWKKRRNASYVAHIRNSVLNISGALPDDSVWFRIVRPNGDAAIIPPKEMIQLSDISFSPQPEPVVTPPDIRRIREFDARAQLGDLFTTISRKFAGRRGAE